MSIQHESHEELRNGVRFENPVQHITEIWAGNISILGMPRNPSMLPHKYWKKYKFTLIMLSLNQGRDTSQENANK